MNVFVAQTVTRRVEAACQKGSSSGQGTLQQDGRRDPGRSEGFAAVLAQLAARSA